MDAVIDFLRDDDMMQQTADQAYCDVFEKGNFGEEVLGKGIDGLIDHMSGLVQ